MQQTVMMENGGISLNFLDKLVIAINERKLSLIASSSDSKILLNRNIIDRAKKVMPYLIYDEEPYLVIGDDNKLYFLNSEVISGGFWHDFGPAWIESVAAVRRAVFVVVRGDGDAGCVCRRNVECGVPE